MMETIRVNMAPCEDVQTIHASQNDNEAREWGFELHNNGEKIDSSSISDQLVFKAYEGGTEEILPTNGSTPTTSPFLGDIKYPQGLLTDQEFLYRQSPTEEDGNAKIKNLYGNTIVWNQLVPSLSAMSAQNGTISVADNVATITSSSSASYLGIATSGSSIVLPKGGHKYLLTVEFNSSKAMTSCSLVYGNSISVLKYNVSANTWTKLSGIVSQVNPTGQYVQFRVFGSFEQGDTMQVRNWNYFDLTAMGLDSLTVNEFTSLFPLPYYAYNQGTLLSFNGNGIKTVGFNQWDEEWEVGAYNSTSGDKTDSVRDRIRNKNPIRVSPSLTYYKNKGLQIYYYDADMNYLGWNSYAIPSIITQLPSNAYYMNFNGLANTGTTYNHDICINISDTERNGTYEPYTSSTLSLPISQYFPNGMKSAGNAYDELSNTKASVRIGSITVDGSEAWAKSASYSGNYYVLGLLSNVKYPNPNAVSNRLLLVYNTTQLSANDLCFMFDGSANSQNVNIKNTSMTTLDQFKAWLQANPVTIYYELANPTETSFSTASLVTENAEIPLSNEDGTLIGKCTEQLSENPGFIDAKIKLADADGECYSNKIQLHVERSPQ